jgi:REP element-mobilizing transposase RayT
MPQSFAASYQHLVFSTKQRTPWLRDKMLRTELHAHIGGVSKRLECAPLIVGGAGDHIHILARLSRTITLANWVKELKRISTTWLKERAAGAVAPPGALADGAPALSTPVPSPAMPALKDFSWQAGYGVFSVSQSNTEAVHDYINKQEEHHRTLTFQEEYRLLLRKHNIEWDENHVWD